MTGRLFVIGVGPGDPGLLTLQARDILGSARRVFIPVSGKGRDSLALDILREHIPAEASVTELVFPMSVDRRVMESAYRKNYLMVTAFLRTGDDAVLATLGDPATYSTAWQVLKLLQRHAPDIECRVVPGVTSFAAAAARARLQLAQGSDCFSVVSSYADPDRLAGIIDASDTVVFLKTYRSRGLVVEALRRRGLLDRCVYIRRCGLPGEEIIRNIETLPEEEDYFSMIILSKKAGDDD